MLAPGSQIGKYLLGKKLGHGGFGVVFRAHDTSLDREVALKFLNDEHTAQPQIMQRFLQEARSAAKIAHPGIVTVFECGMLAEANNAAYIAMELLDGESLTDRLARAGRLPFDEAMEIARQVASALEAAHAAGIVHRDLKPDNIFLVKDPAVPNGERIKVLDFGIAKLKQPSHGPGDSAAASVQTQSMMVFGTPRYMSPEQCKSAAHVDHRSDIYTLGCILFELVCGRPPFHGAPGELIAQHVLVDPPAPRTFVPEIPPALEALIAALLAKEPDDRPQTMAAVQRALESGGALSPGAAPTLLPGAFAAARARSSSGSGFGAGRSSLGGLPVAALSATTLGAAASSSVVPKTSPPRPRRRRVLVGAVGSAVVLAAILLWVALRGGASGAPAAAPPSERDVAKPDVIKPDVIKPDVAKPEIIQPDVKPDVVKPDVAVARPVVETRPPSTRPTPRRIATPPVRTAAKGGEPKPDPKAGAAAVTYGSLTVTTKPGCEIQLDGGASLHTPIRGFKLPVGRHTIALVNTELGVRDIFAFEIAADGEHVINRDYSDRAKSRDRTIDPTKPDPKTDPVKGQSKDKTINPFTKQPASP